MICSSVNFDCSLVRPSRWAGLYYQMEGKPGVTALQAAPSNQLHLIRGKRRKIKALANFHDAIG